MGAASPTSSSSSLGNCRSPSRTPNSSVGVGRVLVQVLTLGATLVLCDMHPAVSDLGLVGRFGTTPVWGLRALLQGLSCAAAVLVPRDLDSLFHVWRFQDSCGVSALVKMCFDLLTQMCPCEGSYENRVRGPNKGGGKVTF